MADTKISDLPPASSLEDDDEFVLATSGTNRKITGATLVGSLPPGPPGPEGEDGVIQVYEQPSEPSTTEVGAMWIDTDEAPPTWVGPPPGGVTDLNYVHTQSSASALWMVTHNLNKYPSVTVIDTGGNVLIPDVIYDDLNSVRVGFAAPTSGKAVFN